MLSVQDISNWESKQFSGNTEYQKTVMAGRPCIKASSHKSASGLFREIDIDLSQRPVMHWDWFVRDTLGNDLDETTKDGDDYAARLYVVISGGVFFWQTRALNYVWANRIALGTSWPNAFSDHATMLAVESGGDQSGRWVHESRNVLNDIRDILKLDKQVVNAVAIMTDTDNSGRNAVACYGDIYFTAQ